MQLTKGSRQINFDETKYSGVNPINDSNPQWYNKFKTQKQKYVHGMYN